VPTSLLLSGLLVHAQEPKPTRGAFICEVLDAKPTAVTPKFDDYTPGSYHIVKEDLLKGLIEESEKRGLDLRGVIVAGPMRDPLWTYYVTAFFREGDKVRVNLLIFPHARITYKSTGLIENERYERWVADLRGTGMLQDEPPAEVRDEEDPVKRDQGYTLLLASRADGGDCRVGYADTLAHEEKLEEFQDLLNSIFEGMEQTYSVYEEDQEGEQEEFEPLLDRLKKDMEPPCSVCED